MRRGGAIRRLRPLLLLLPATSLWGQEDAMLVGTVYDRQSGEPMAAVNISADRSLGTTTNTDGMFKFDLPPGTHVIEFYYVGYEMEKRIVELDPGQILRIGIRMSVISRMLEEVVVTAGKYEQKLSDVTVSMEVIKPRQLSSQNIHSLDMILERTSGIAILDGQPSIRGGSGFSYGVGSRVLMLVDDLPMISADAGDIKWNFLPVENLNQIEVIKGASSVLYGSSALNGVINLRTKFPGNDPSTEITAFGGIYMNPDRKELIWWDRAPVYGGGSFSHLRKIGNLDLNVGGNYFKNEGYREMEYEHRIRGNLALRYRFPRLQGLTAGISVSGMYIDQSDFLLWQNADSGAYRQNPASFTPLFGHRYYVDPYLEYFTEGGSKHSLKTRLYSVGNATLDSDKSSFSKLWYGEYRFQKKVSPGTTWTSGISFSRNTVLANLYEDHRGSNSAAYSQLNIRIGEKLKLTSGVRWEVNTLNGEWFFSSPVFRAGGNYQLARATYLRASFGQGYRFPSVAEKFASAEIGGLHIFNNPELEPERGWSAEAGIKQGFTLAGWMGLADLAFFWTEYDHMIEYTFGAYPPDSVEIPSIDDIGFKALNIGHARITGAEVTLSGQGEAGPVEVSLVGGYTYMNPVDPGAMQEGAVPDDESHVLKYRRRHLVKGDLQLDIRKLFAGVTLQYHSRMVHVDQVFIDDLVGNLLQPGFPGYWEDHATGYSLVDLRLGWRVAPSFRINLLMRNALNVEYLGRPGDIGPPRQFTVQLKSEF